ncbi:ABC transporter substrate-binding protein [Blautia schinkii]|nr:ABC transporter substrate-binding protein [Blautia schinkii]
MRKKMLAVLLTAAMTMGLGGSTVMAAEAPETVKLNVAYMPNYAALWAVTTGMEKGYFEEQGIEITLYEFADGPTEIAAMDSGSIDIAYIGPGAHKLCINGQATVFNLQQIGDADCVIGLPSHGVEKLEDLKGKTVAYASGTSSEMLLNTALASVDMTLEDITAMDMDPSNMVTAMVSGSVDACATWSPNSTQIINELPEAVKMCSNMTYADQKVDPASWICKPDYAKENHDILVRFNKALFKAMDFGSDEANYEEVAGYVSKQCATDLDTALAQTGDGKWFNGEEIQTMIEDGTMENYYLTQQQGFIATGDVEKEVPVSDYVDFSAMTDAADYK